MISDATAMEATDSFVARLWRRIPIIPRAILIGLAVSAAGNGPWQVLALTNLAHPWALPVPWSVLAMAALLWLFWQWLQGRGWPRSTAEARRRGLRAVRLSGRVWCWALLAGVLGLASVIGLQRLIARLVELPRDPLPDLSRFSGLEILSFIFMISLVAGVAEEAGFRGYMQGAIERRHGVVVAILVTGTVFGLIHASHASWVLASMPVFLGVSAVFGALAWITGSILPGVVLHTAVDVASFLWAWRMGEPVLRPLVWKAGPDSAFWAAVLVFVLGGAAAVWACHRLALVVRPAARSSTVPGKKALPRFMKAPHLQASAGDPDHGSEPLGSRGEARVAQESSHEGG